jgi:chemotaxis protein MotB
MSKNTLVIKRVEEDDHDDHHGGGWKVAYADFMTAMMAFFLLLWIVSAADSDQLKGLAEYFAPVLSQSSGGGPQLLDGQMISEKVEPGGGAPTYLQEEMLPEFGRDDPLMVFDSRLRYAQEDAEEELIPPGKNDSEVPEEMSEKSIAAEAESGAESAAAAVAAEAREADFEAIEDDIRQQLAEVGLEEHFAQNLRFAQSPEGLDIHIVDQPGLSMFASGSSRISDEARQIVDTVARALMALPNKVLISGHTDAVPFSGAGYDNWDLSAERANATRRLLLASGVEERRIARVSGLADTDPLIPERPDAPENRRVSIKLLYPESL